MKEKIIKRRILWKEKMQPFFDFLKINILLHQDKTVPIGMYALPKRRALIYHYCETKKQPRKETRLPMMLSIIIITVEKARMQNWNVNNYYYNRLIFRGGVSNPGSVVALRETYIF